mgnify:CR=1 FL=1
MHSLETGTLDPLATGLLIVCTGRFTKRIPKIQGQEKIYTGSITLGGTTPSYDLETKIDNEYAPQIKTVNTRIQELRQQAQLKTEDIDTKIIQLEEFIESEQTVADNARVTKLQHESKYREIEVDVGPVKYIADMIYGDDARTMLDSAVRAVIITLIFVFDPLAILLVVAGAMSFKSYREEHMPKDVLELRQQLIGDLELHILDGKPVESFIEKYKIDINYKALDIVKNYFN